MEEDTEQFCTNCKRHVASPNFAIHSAFCERNIYVCKMCDEPVPISDKSQHLEEYHVIFTCDLCEVSLEKWMLPKHMESCPRRRIACEYCEADLPFDELPEHMDFCGSRTEKCLLCQKYIMIKEKDKHEELHVYEKKFRSKNIEEEIKQNKVNEVISETGSAEKRSEKALGIVSSLASKKREGADAYFSDKSKGKIRKDDQHLEIPTHVGAVASALEKEEISKHYTQCHVCKQPVRWIDYNAHVPTCASSAGKCSLCGEDVPSCAMKDHMKEHYQGRLEKPSFKVPQNDGSCSKIASKSDDSYAGESKTLGAFSSLASKMRVADACFSDKSKNTIRKEDQHLEIPVHEGAAASSPGKGQEISKHYTQCHICKETIRWIDYNTHVPTCASSAGKCSLCGEDVPSYAIKDHMKEHYQGRLEKPSFKVPQNIGSRSKTTFKSDESYAGESKADDARMTCPYCSQQFYQDKILEHTRICPKNVYECPLCCEDVSERNRIMHETIDCKMLQESVESYRPYHTRTPMNVYECPLCHEKVSETDRVRHETSDCRMIKDSDESNKLYFSRNSSQTLYECPLCSEHIPEENRDRHLSFECKKLFDSNETQSLYGIGNSSSNMYECPYCSEKMPENDRAMHQTFHCKVLIANSGLNIYGSESYAEVTKKTCKGNCKCHQPSEVCPICKNKIPKHKIIEHRNSCTRLKLPCLHCNELIDPQCEGIHINFCRALNDGKKYTDLKSRVAENSRFSNYEYKGAIPKNTNIRDMMKPRSAKCKFCQTTLNADILKFHEDECIHKPVQCPDCSKEIMVKDINLHKCKRKKGKGKNQKMEQQTSEGKEEPGFWKRTMQFLKFSEEEGEDKGQYRGLRPPNYNADHKPVPDSVANRGNLYFEHTDDTLLPCEFCQKEFPASELVLHETGCQPDLVSYAKPDSESNLNQSSSRQGCVSLPSNVGPVKKDSASTQSIHASGRSNSFFPGSNSILQSATYERIERNKNSEVKPGEFLQPHFNKGLSKQHGNPKMEENADKGKKTERVKVQSFWNAGSSDDLRAEDDLKQISDCSDAEMDVDETEEINGMNKKETEGSKELEGQVSGKLSVDDNEMADMLNFLERSESIESDEKYVILSDDKGEPKNSGTEVCSVLGLKDNMQEKHQRDSPVSKKTTIEESEKMGLETSQFMGSRVHNQKEYASSHLADFKFGAFKPTALSDENKVHYAFQSKSFEVPEKLHKQKASKHIEMSEEQRDHVRNVRHLPDLKLGRCGSASFSGQVVDQTKEKNEEEPKKMHKLKATNGNESSKDQIEYENSFKHLGNFKSGTYKSTDVPEKENMHCPVRPEKNDSDQEKPYEQKSPKSRDSAKVEEDYVNNLKHLADFKISTHEPTTSFDEKNMFCKVLPAKNRKEPEKSGDQKTSRYVDSKMDDMEYLRNFRQHLPDFKFGVLETKSSENNVHNTFLSEKRNGYGERAFKLERGLHVSSRTTIDKKSKKVHNEASSHIDDSRKDNEKCVINIKYASDIKFGTHAKSYEDSVSSEKCAFTLEAAGSLLKKETKFPTDSVMNKETKGLEEKIAALKTRNFKTDDENDDVKKWKKWRNKVSKDNSDSD